MDQYPIIFITFQFLSKINILTLASSYNAQDFHDLLQEPYYIDKTDFIKTVFDSKSHKILLSSPRGFGKTINLQMFQLFAEIELDDYGVPKHPTNSTAFKIFGNLTIFKYPDIFNNHMATYPVLFVDLEATPVIESFTRQNIIRHINAKLYDTFAKHSWMLQIPQEVLVNHYGINSFMINFMKKLNERNLDNENENNDNVLHKMLLNLVTILRQYYRNNVIILVDNYDSMVSNSRKPSGKGILMYYEYVNNILQKAFESADQPVAGGLITGVSGLVLSNLDTYLSHTQLHPFMGEESKFTEYFGFKQNEVIQLLDLYKCSDKANEIKSYYNGYKTIYQNLAIYNPASVIQYLNNLNNNPLRVYWSNSIVDNFLLSFMNDTLFGTIIDTVINNGTTGFHMAESYTSENFHLFFNLCQKYAYNSTDQGILLWFLYDHGYLSHRIIEMDKPAQFLDAMGAPNLETRKALRQLYHQTATDRICI